MFKIFIFCVCVAILTAQDSGRPCNEDNQSGINNELNSNANSVNRQQRQGFRGFSRSNQFSSNDYPNAANPPIGSGTNFPSGRFSTGQFGFNQQASQFGNRFDNQQFGLSLGYRNGQNGQFRPNQFPNNQFGSNDQNAGSFQGRQFQ